MARIFIDGFNTGDGSMWDDGSSLLFQPIDLGLGLIVFKECHRRLYG